MLRKALKMVTPSLRDIAREIGMSYHAVRQYRLGERTPAPAVLHRLAQVLRRRAADLVAVAEHMEREIRKP